MTLNKVTRAQEGIPTSQSGSPATKAAKIGQKMSKITPKISCSALAGNSKDVTLAINQLLFIKLPQVILLGLTRGFPDHKTAPLPQMRLSRDRHIHLFCPLWPNYKLKRLSLNTAKLVTMRRTLLCYLAFLCFLTSSLALLGASAKSRCLGKLSHPYYSAGK